MLARTSVLVRLHVGLPDSEAMTERLQHPLLMTNTNSQPISPLQLFNLRVSGAASRFAGVQPRVIKTRGTGKVRMMVQSSPMLQLMWGPNFFTKQR